MSYLEELLPEFRKGAKIRLNNWQEDEYIFMDDTLAKDSNGYAFNFNLKHLFCDNWEFYREPEPDWDYIIKNKCLCWFWCEGEEERRIAGLLSYYDSYENQFARYKGKDVAVTYFDHCRPVRRDEVTFYEDRKDAE